MIFDWNRCCAVAEVRELTGDAPLTLPGPGLWAGILSSGRCRAEGTGGYDGAGASGDLLLCGGSVTLVPIEDCHLLAVRLGGSCADGCLLRLGAARWADGARVRTVSAGKTEDTVLWQIILEGIGEAH